MGFFLSFIFALVIYVVGALLNRPNLENAKATPFEEAQFPDIDPRKKMPVGWGTVRFTSLFVLDITDYRTEKIRKKVKTSPITKKKVTVGYRYFVTMGLGIARGGAVPYELRQIYWEDELLVDTVLTGNDNGQAIVVNEPEFLGGEENGGGLRGTIRWYPGSTTQNIDPTLDAAHSPNEVPAYRNLSYFVLEDFEIGERANIQPIQVVMRRIVNTLGASDPDLGPSQLDINPMCVVYDIFNNDDYGMGLGSADLNVTELRDIADDLSAETPPLGMSLKWAQNEAIKKLFERIQDHIDGVIFFFDGQWTALLTRNDYTVGSLPVFDDDINSKLIRFSRSDPSQQVNTIELNYIDRTVARRPSAIFVQDSANFERAGRNRGQTLDYPTIYEPEVANFIAARELHARGFSLANIELEVNREAYALKPSEPFVYENPTLGIQQLVMRAVEVALGTPRNRTIRLRALEDVFGIGAAIIAPPSVEAPPVVQNPQTITIAPVLDQPYLINLVNPDVTAPQVPGLAHMPMAWPVKPQGNALGYRLRARVSPDSFIDEEELDYGPKGVLQSALDEGTADLLPSLTIINAEEGGLLIPDINQSEIQVQFLGHFAIFTTDANAHQNTDGTFAEPEILAYESAVQVGGTITLTNVHRALMDTMQQPALASDRVVFFDGHGSTVTDEYLATSLVDMRFVNLATSGEGSESGTFSVQMRNRVNRPFPAANFDINGDRYPDSPVVQPPSFQVPTGDIIFNWDDRDRLDNRSRFQDDGSFTMESGLEYRLQIYEEDGGNNLLRTETIAAGVETYTYTSANIAADGGPFEFYRVELRAHPIGTPTTDENIIDVIRRFRYEGGVTSDESSDAEYQRFVEGSSGIDHYFPLTERTPAFFAQDTVGAVPTTVFGGVAPNAYSLVGDFNAVNAGFDGVLNTRIEAADDPSWDFTGAWSIVVWFAVGEEPSGSQVLLLRENGINTNDTLALYIDTSGHIVCELRDQSGAGIDSSYDTGTDLPSERFDDGQPHCVIIKKAGPGLGVPEMRIDGYFVASFAGLVNQLFNSSEPMQIGGDSSGNFRTPRGVIGHVAFYDQNIAADQVRTHWRIGRRFQPFDAALERMARRVGTGVSVGFAGWWPLNDLTTQGAGDMSLNAISGTSAGTGGGPTGRQASQLAGLQGTYYPAMLFNGTDHTMSLGSPGYNHTHGVIGISFATTAVVAQVLIGANENISTDHFFGIQMLATGEIRLLVRRNTGTNFFDMTTVPTFNDGLVHHVAIEKGGNLNTPIIIVDGVEHTVGNGLATENTGGTGANTDWINEVANDAGGAGILDWMIGARDRGGSTDLFFDGTLSNAYIFGSVNIFQNEIKALHAGAVQGFRGASDIMLDEGLYHLFEVTDFANNDDVLDHMNSVLGVWQNTALGELTNQIPLAVDDELRSVYVPRDNTGGGDATYLRWANFGFLELVKGNVNFHDYGALFQYMKETDDQGMFFTNSDDILSTEINMFSESNTGGIVEVGKFEPSDKGLKTENVQDHRGRVVTMGYRELFIGGGSPPADMAVGRRRIVQNRREVGYSQADTPTVGNNRTDLVEVYPNTAIDSATMLAWEFSNADDDRNHGGLVNRLAFWDRAVSIRRLLINTLRAQGWHEHALYIRGFEPLGFWRCNEPTGGVGGEVLDFSGSGRNMDVSGVDAVLGGAEYAREWTDAQGFLESNRTGAFADCWLGIDGGKVPFNDTDFRYPMAVGGWMRPDGTGGFDNALISWGETTQDNRFVMNARGDSDLFGISTVNNGVVNTVQTAAFPGGLADTWRHVVFNFLSAISCDIYVDGEFFANLVPTAIAWPNPPNRFRFNAQASSSGDPNSTFNSSLHDIFVIDTNVRGGTALTAEEIREMYVKALPPNVDHHILDDAPIGYWKLNDHEEGNNTYRNSVRDSNGHIIEGVASGLMGTVAAPIDTYPDNAPEFDGSSELQTNWFESPAGSAARSFEFFCSNGWTGTFFGLGANTDLRALVLYRTGVDDITVGIRGAGETLTFTATGITLGGNHHVALVLDGTTLNDFRLWVDGAEITTTSGGSASTVNTLNTFELTLGRDPTDLGQADGDGVMSRFAVYDAVLSAHQIRRHAAAGGII